MAFVQEDICRFVVEQRLEGRDVVNILDYQIDTTGSTSTRAEAIEEMASIILQEWHDSIRPMQIDDLELRQVSWVDLDDVDGTTGSTVDGSGAAVWPSTGTSAGLPLPANVAVLVHKNVIATRNTRSGRMYLCGWSEGISDAGNGNAVTAAELVTINTNLAAFLGDTNQDSGIPGSYQSFMAVVHTLSSVNPDPPPDVLIEPNGYSLVNSLTADSTFGTMRRRLRG